MSKASVMGDIFSSAPAGDQYPPLKLYPECCVTHVGGVTGECRHQMAGSAQPHSHLEPAEDVSEVCDLRLLN